MKKLLRIFVVSFIILLLNTNVFAEVTNITANTFVIYNGDEVVDISIMKYYSDENRINPALYVAVNELYMLGLDVYDIEGGFTLSNGTTTAYVYYDGSPVKIDNYTFGTPLLNPSDGEYYLRLDIIGKCFSTKYSGTLVGDVWNTYIDTGIYEEKIELVSLNIKSTVFDFENNVYSMQVENSANVGAEDVSIYTAYYSADGRLMDLSVDKKQHIESKQEFTVINSLKDSFDNAAKIQIMVLSGVGTPLVEKKIVKDFCFNTLPAPPDDRVALFPDVDVDNMFYDAIYVMNEAGLFNSYEDGNYYPDYYVSRAKFCFDLCRLLGLNFRDNDVDCYFADVKDSHWAKNYIGYVVSKGYLTTEDGNFYPNKNITWNETISIFKKLLGDKSGCNITENTNPSIYLTRGNFTQIVYNYLK